MTAGPVRTRKTGPPADAGDGRDRHRGTMIEARELTKRYGATTAVNALSFTVRPGRVTGFLGPNGAGKTTTLRLILGLTSPTSGAVTVGGVPFRDHPRGLRHVGALLDAADVHPDAPRAHICPRWLTPTAFRGAGSPKCSARSACRASRAAASEGSRSG